MQELSVGRQTFQAAILSQTVHGVSKGFLRSFKKYRRVYICIFHENRMLHDGPEDLLSTTKQELLNRKIKGKGTCQLPRLI